MRFLLACKNQGRNAISDSARPVDRRPVNRPVGCSVSCRPAGYSAVPSPERPGRSGPSADYPADSAARAGCPVGSARAVGPVSGPGHPGRSARLRLRSRPVPYSDSVDLPSKTSSLFQLISRLRPESCKPCSLQAAALSTPRRFVQVKWQSTCMPRAGFKLGGGFSLRDARRACDLRQPPVAQNLYR